MRDAERYWDRVADRYAARAVRDPSAYEATLERTRAHLGEGCSVLELGCGTGTTALRLADAAQSITAIDFAAAMLSVARQRAEAQGVASVAFRQADLFDEERVPGPFDAVLAFNLLHLTGDIARAARSAARRLKPDGVFISKTICLGEPDALRYRLIVSVLRRFGVLPAMAYVSAAALEQAIEGAGFRIIERGDYPASPRSRFIVARRR